MMGSTATIHLFIYHFSGLFEEAWREPLLTAIELHASAAELRAAVADSRYPQADLKAAWQIQDHHSCRQ